MVQRLSDDRTLTKTQNVEEGAWNENLNGPPWFFPQYRGSWLKKNNIYEVNAIVKILVYF